MPWVTITCSCCRLPQRVREYDSGREPTMCGTCIEHRGANAEMVLRRAQDHENMLRSRCEEARKAANSLEERMKSALRSRERAIRYLAELNEIHRPRLDGSCACGLKHSCQSVEILSSQWVRNMIGNVEMRDIEERGEWPDGG